MRLFCRKNHVHKIPRLGGGVFWVLGGGGSADFIFLGARIFLKQTVFSKRCFSEWCAERAVRIRTGRRHQNALKQWCFEETFCPSEGVFLCRKLRWGIWKTPFGKHRLELLASFEVTFLAGVLRGNTIRGNTTRNSERKMALWEGLWEGLWKTSENL